MTFDTEYGTVTSSRHLRGFRHGVMVRDSFGKDIKKAVGTQLGLRFLVAEVHGKVSQGGKRGAKV